MPSGYALTVRDTAGGNKGSITGASQGVFNQGSFTLTTGGIRNKSGTGDGVGLCNDAGGVATITGGVIEGNVAESIADGAGIYNCGQLQVTGGSIQNNQTSDTYGNGGGIYNARGGNFTLSGGTIQGNTACKGGGVYNDYDCEVMVVMGRAKNQSNTATDQGGGIYNAKSSDGTKLALLGGVISNNTAGSNGGGIANLGVMAASAGTISNNTAALYGGGIYDEGSLALSGNPIVKGNTGADGVENDTYLAADKRITIEDAFNSRASVGVVCKDPHQLFTDGYEKHNPDAAADAYFFANPNGDQEDVRLIWDENEYPGELHCVVIIHYRDASGAEYECMDYEDATSDEWGLWDTTSWYVVREDTAISDDIVVKGDVNLILCSNKTLRTEGVGIRRKGGGGDRAKLTIWNSMGDDGYLVADAGSGDAGIGYRAGSGGGENCCGGDFVAQGGIIHVVAGEECATGIGAGHGDYHEGTKTLYSNAKVTATQTTEADARVMNADERVAACGWHEVWIEPCGHQGSTFTDLDYAKHKVSGPCAWCGLQSEESEEQHSFGEDHTCVCGHVEDPILFMSSSTDELGTTYVSRGSSFSLPRMTARAASLSENMVLDGWKATGLDGVASDTVLAADTAITVKPAEGFDKITLVAQWSEAGEHTHYLTHHAAVPATCEGEGTIEYWYCDQGAKPCGKYYSDAQGYNEISPDALAVEPLGHEWGEATYTWSSDHVSCTGTHTCTRDSSHTETVQCDYVWGPFEKAATCTEDGGRYYLALFYSHSGFKTQTSVEKTADATGHVWNAPTYEWSDDHGTCTATRTCSVNPDHEESETVASTVATEGATCTNEGTITFTATFANTAFATQTWTGSGVDPTGHAWKEPTYKWSDDHEACTAMRMCANNALHFEFERVEAVVESSTSATCETAGSTVYAATFKNRAFTAQTYSDVTPALGRVLGEWTTTKEATATETGLQTRSCTRDGCAYSETRDIPAGEHAHVLERVEAKAASCTEAGNIEYWRCTMEGCGKLFKDEYFSEALTQEQTVIAALGHEWGEARYLWSNDNSTCIAMRFCTRNVLHFQMSEAQVSTVEDWKPTCDLPGKVTYTATFANSAFDTQTKSEYTKPLGNDWGEWEQVKAPDCLNAGMEQRVCSREGCSFPTMLREVPALGYKWGEWVVTTPATETSEGVETRTCSRCGETETRSVPALVVYRCVDSDGASWTKGSGGQLALTFKRSYADDQTFGLFSEIYVDGSSAPANDAAGTVFYTVESGSLVLKLQPAFLETLPVGDHVVTALFKDGEGQATFTVKAAPSKEEGEEGSGEKDGEKGEGKGTPENEDSPSGESPSGDTPADDSLTGDSSAGDDSSGDGSSDDADGSSATKASSAKSSTAKTGDAVPLAALIAAATVALAMLSIARRRLG